MRSFMTLLYKDLNMNRMVFSGFLMMAVMMILLLRTKIKPMVVFIVLPVVTGIGIGVSASDLLLYILAGLENVFPTAILFASAILFFGLLDAEGVFEWTADKLKRRMKDNERSIMILTVMVSVIAHLSGSGAVSYLITTNACRNMYERNRIPATKLMCLCSLTFGVMNMIPWGGPCGRLAAVLNVPSSEIWRYCIPSQLFGICVVFLIALYMSRHRKNVETGIHIHAETEPRKERPLRVQADIAVLAVVLILLILLPVEPFIIFITGAVILMLVNKTGREDRKQITVKCAKQAAPVVITVLSTGVLTGILTQSPLLDSMSLFFAELLPQTVSSHAPVLLGTITSVSSWFVSGEVQIFGLVPIAAQLADHVGIAPAVAGATFLIPYSAVIFVLPTTVSVHLGLELCGVSIRDHVKETYKWSVLCSLSMLGFAILSGVLPI